MVLNASKLIAIGADHGGFKDERRAEGFSDFASGHQVHDFGTNSEDAVDYPDFAYAVGGALPKARLDVGIVIDGAGVGSAMTANKVPGVAPQLVTSLEVARNSREHNGANVFDAPAAKHNSAQMRDIVRAWLCHGDDGGSTSQTFGKD